MPSAQQFLLLCATLTALSGQSPVTEKQRAAAALQQIHLAKTVYFDDQTRVTSKVGEKAAEELKKWGRFKIVEDRTQADLILLFSLHKYEGGYEVYRGGQTGAANIHGKSQEDLAPSYVRSERAQAGFLTAINPKTGEALWSYSQRWGGLLTGFDSVGVRLIRRFEKEMK
jgi:hypothetical protein